MFSIDYDELSDETLSFARELHRYSTEAANLLEESGESDPEYNPLKKARNLLKQDAGEFFGQPGDETVAEMLVDDPDELLGYYRELEEDIEYIKNSGSGYEPPSAVESSVERRLEALAEMTFNLVQTQGISATGA
ncbi:MAG: hypothetical protein ABEJ56_05230 [Candidatus Nanohaloarchaea archaeon]